LLTANQKTEQGIFDQRGASSCSRRSWPAQHGRSARPAQPGRRPGEEERVDHRRRRLGLRHRLRRPRSRAGLRRNVNVLVLDTRFTPTPAAKASNPRPRGAVAKFAAAGKPIGKEGPGHDGHELRHGLTSPKWPWDRTTCTPSKAFLEAEAYDGPSLIHRLQPLHRHGYDLTYGMEQQKAAVNSAYWPRTATIPNWSPRARTPSSSIPKAATIGSRNTPTTRPATPCSQERSRTRQEAVGIGRGGRGKP